MNEDLRPTEIHFQVPSWASTHLFGLETTSNLLQIGQSGSVPLFIGGEANEVVPSGVIRVSDIESPGIIVSVPNNFSVGLTSYMDNRQIPITPISIDPLK
jgi:hypothetical protein